MALSQNSTSDEYIAYYGLLHRGKNQSNGRRVGVLCDTVTV